MQRLQDLLSKNGALKAAAVALALLLWTAVRVDAPAERTFREVPVTIELADPNWTVRGQPAPVTVRFTGSTRDLFPLTAAQTRIVVPITEVNGRDTTVIIEREWIRSGSRPAGPTSDAVPSAIRVRFDRVETRDANVSVLALGEPAEGYALAAAPTTVPRVVRVRGSEEALRGIREVTLEPLTLQDYTETSTVMRAIDLGGLAGVQVEPDSVSVVLAVEQRVERTFNGVPIDYEFSAVGDRPAVDTLSVLVSGARTVVARLTPDDFRVAAARDRSIADSVVWTVRIQGLPEWVAVESTPTVLRVVADPTN